VTVVQVLPGHLHNLVAENRSWARDVNGRDRDETETSASRDRDETETSASRDRDETETSASRDRDETETLTIFLETRPRRDVGTSRDRLETETLRPRPQPWVMIASIPIGKNRAGAYAFIFSSVFLHC